MLSVSRAYKVRSRLILQILALCSSAACILVQSRWPQIHSAKALIEPQLLADKVNFSPYALPWKRQPCSVCCVMTQSTSYDSHKSYFSIGTGPHWAICSNLTTADNAQVCPVHCLHSAIKLTMMRWQQLQWLFHLLLHPPIKHAELPLYEKLRIFFLCVQMKSKSS